MIICLFRCSIILNRTFVLNVDVHSLLFEHTILNVIIIIYESCNRIVISSRKESIRRVRSWGRAHLALQPFVKLSWTEMFFYLSFLRPPPQTSTLSSPIYITPQIANDLRTEIFEDTQDIHYSWLRTPDNNINNWTKLVKLTTWRGQSSAYKSLSIPPPPGVRDGQTWRLCLTANNHSVIDLKGEHTGDMPFPVLSMPISFSSRSNLNHNGAAKQEQIERLYKVSGSDSSDSGSTHRLLRIKERTSYDLDKVS